MTAIDPLPRAAEPFVSFASVLRANGFPAAPEQTALFLQAVGLLGPSGIDDVYRAAVATLAPTPERRVVFDVLFRSHFLGQTLAVPVESDATEEEMRVQDDVEGWVEPPEPDEENQAGEHPASTEMLGVRYFPEVNEAETLRRFRRRASAYLPRRRSYRRTASRQGDAWNMRRMLREAVRHEGEVLALPKLRRKEQQRRVLLLIDVSGSMADRTDGYLRFAHALSRAAERLEVFTLGTRLTRITRAMRLRNRDQALALASGLVADWDGGTRIGDALQAFLSVPRFAGFARGAVVLVVSDGLERGDPASMTDAVERLARGAWKVLWLTPLAADPNFTPETEALRSILPFVGRLGDASSIERLCAQILDLGREPA